MDNTCPYVISSVPLHPGCYAQLRNRDRPKAAAFSAARSIFTHQLSAAVSDRTTG